MKSIRRNNAEAIDLSEVTIELERIGDRKTFEFLKELARESFEIALKKKGLNLPETVLEDLSEKSATAYYMNSPRLIRTEEGNTAFVLNESLSDKGGKRPKTTLFISDQKGQLTYLINKTTLNSVTDVHLINLTDQVCDKSIYKRERSEIEKKGRRWLRRGGGEIWLGLTKKAVRNGYWPGVRLMKELRADLRISAEQGVVEKGSERVISKALGVLEKKFEGAMPTYVMSQWQEFTEALPQDLIQSLTVKGRFNLDDYNFCAGAEDAEKRTYRRQWINAYPGLVDHKDFKLMAEVIPIIDQALPFGKVFASHYGAKSALVKRFAKPGWDMEIKSEGRNGAHFRETPIRLGPRRLFSLFRDLPVSNVPLAEDLSKEEFRKIWQVIQNCCNFSASFGQVSGEEDSSHMKLVRHLITGSKGNWKKSAESLEQEGENAVFNTKDFIKTFYRRVFLPVFLRSLPAADLNEFGGMRSSKTPLIREFCQLISKQSDLLKLIQLSKEWHSFFEEDGNDNRFDPGTFQEWDPLCQEQISPSGYRLIPLCNTSALMVEGKAMGHCVGTYAKKCRTGNSYIFSVRDTENSRIATFELKTEDDSVRIAQVQGRFNKLSSEDVRDAAEWLVEEINYGNVNVDFEALSRVKLKSGLFELCDFDFRDDEKCADAFEEFRWALPAELRKLDWKSFSEHHLITDLIEEFLS